MENNTSFTTIPPTFIPFFDDQMDNNNEDGTTPTTLLSPFLALASPLVPLTASTPIASNATTDDQIVWLFSLNCFELLAHFCLDCPFSALNFFLICRTSILHPNLKFILLCQSTCIFVRGTDRAVLNLMRVTGAVGMMSSGPYAMALIYTYPVFMRNFLAHVLVIERILATIFVRSYEHSKKPYFSAIWFTLVVILTSLQILATDRVLRYCLTMMTISLVLVEIIIFFFIWKYNDGIYNKMFLMHSLTERYQLSENIRTGKQLIPTLMLYFINIVVDTLVMTFGFFQTFGPSPFISQLILQIAYCIGSVVNFFIELSMLVYHPFLKRDFVRLWRKIIHRSIGHSSVNSETSIWRRESALAMKNMRGTKLVLNRQEEAEGHFQHLNDAWKVTELDKNTGSRRLHGNSI